jgi:glucosamine--fructose-6-phosphate aminotransferase (isomerizing)
VSLAAPSTVTLYERGPDLSDALVIGVSQSGRGEDVVAYLRAARAQGAATVAIVNDAAAPLAEAAEWILDCLAGPELSVPATKSVTAQMTTLALLSAALADGDRFPSVLDTLPDAVDRAHTRRSEARALARTLAGLDVGAVVGRGFAYPVALELALKLKETTYRRAEPFSAADFFHGPVALVEEGYSALVVDVGGRSTTPALAVCAEVQRRGGQPFLLRAGGSAPTPPDLPTISVPGELDEPYAAIPALVLGQLVAVELALALGIDPSQPRGLQKVTSTR